MTVPTEKQIEYARYLAQRMCQDLPKDFTKQAYSDFISKWKPDGVHYWMYRDNYCRGLTPRYDNKGNLVIESNY